MKLRVLILILFLFHSYAAITCIDTNCAVCYGTGNGQCSKCKPTYFLQEGSCLTPCTTTPEYYMADTYDNICKKTRYKYDYECPAGTYNPSEKKGALTDCLKCPKGFYCPQIGYGIPPVSCEAGYYCNEGSIVGTNDDTSATLPISNTQPCPIGFYCPIGSSDPIKCPAGQYCGSARLSASNGNCEAGYICKPGSIMARPDFAETANNLNGYVCPKGYYCEAGATDKKPCQPGSYLNSIGGKTIADCLKCPAGKYCDAPGASAPTGDCAPGYFCPAGSIVSDPQANYCPIGHMCPGGNAAPIPCDPDKYQTAIKQTSCLICDPGYYCYDGTKRVSCPAGSYCPGNNELVNCPPGTYKDVDGGVSFSSCKSCTAGLVCETPGTVSPSITCAPGYYCTEGSKTRFPRGTNGNLCTAGHYCPERSAQELPCPGGEYCAIEGLSKSTGKCQEGYYCPENSFAKKGTLIECTQGHFCPRGSVDETPCPVGTYGPLRGAASIDDCIPCDMGKYCNSQGMSAPNTILCSVGYYCPLSQYEGEPSSYICPRGYKCPEGSAAPTPCDAGTYQPLTKQSTCDDCPAGYYCDGIDGAQRIECPRGYYCPVNTKVANEHPCPIGTYNDKLLKIDDTACEPCPKGYYCPEKGQSSYADLCALGYYCMEKASVPNPDDMITGWRCSPGYYCPEGTQSEVECSGGTFYDYYYAQDSIDCQNIPPGKFSSIEGATTSILNAAASTDYGNCDAGYICKGGSSSATPFGTNTGSPCRKGYYCPAGTTTELYCPLGTYGPSTGLGVCNPCTAGKYCNDLMTIDPVECTAFHYCPEGSTRPKPCPAGTMSIGTGVQSEFDCTPCPGGVACETPATESDQTKCSPGYVCSEGSEFEKPMYGVYEALVEDNGFCPKGSYCGLGSASPTQCLEGTFQDATGTSSCKQCPPGYACDTKGMTEVTSTNWCEEGYICSGGSNSKIPSGLECSIDHYCVQGTTHEELCKDGEYQPVKGKPNCITCPKGMICYIEYNTVANTQIVKFVNCPEYYYCPGGNGPTGLFCEPGTRSTAGNTGLESADECLLCPVSKYCIDSGKAGDFDSCAAGYFCKLGAKSPTPKNCPPLTTCDPMYPDSVDPENAYLCPPGHFCGLGTLEPSKCGAGFFRQEPGAMSSDDCTDCLPGQYCVQGNPIPYLCPKGSYCPVGSSTYNECPIGTYNPNEGAKYNYECVLCLQSYFCSVVGIGDITSYTCPAASYCPPGVKNPIYCVAGLYISGSGATEADCQACHEFYYCPAKTEEEKRCPGGRECPDMSPAPAACQAGYCCYWETVEVLGVTQYIAFKKDICPPGYYCETGTENCNENLCPDGYVCPQGSYRPMKCPYGSFLDASKIPTMVVLEDACKYCEPGYYADVISCAVCPAGFVCLGRTINKYPIDPIADKGYECPPGHYCPAGSYKEIACPIGTYRNMKKGESLADCYKCPENTFNDRTGQATCRKCGASASSQAGSTSCVCEGQFREFFKSDSSCRCISGFYQVKYGIKDSRDDSTLDCEPHVYKNCGKDKIYNYNGECVKEDDCEKHCNGKSGSYSKDSGVCVCDDLPSVDEVCDANCRSKALKVTITGYSIVITDPMDTSKTTTISLRDSHKIYTDYFDPGSTISSIIKSVGNSNGYFKGQYGAVNSFKTQFELDTRRRLQSSNSDSISSPMICTTPQETMAFDVSATHYPVYLKDSLVNTVPNFDYGPFVSLADSLTKATTSIDTFLYRFNTIGNYLFGDSNDYSSQMLIVVRDTCNNMYAMPMTDKNLEAYGVKLRDDVIHKIPLWAYMLTVCLLFMVLTGGAVVIKLKKEALISWTYGKDTANVLDAKGADEPSEGGENGEDEIENLLKHSGEDVDGLFFVYFKQKLNEMDEKMKDLLSKANISSLKKLKKLADRIGDLKKIFSEHVGSLTMPNGLTIDDYLKANADKLDQDSSYYSSIIDSSEDRSDAEGPGEGDKKDLVLPQEDNKSEDNREPEIKEEVPRQDELEIVHDTKKIQDKANEDKEKVKEEVKSVLQNRRDDFAKMAQKHADTGNNNDIQDLVKAEGEHLYELQGKLMDELDAQNGELEAKLMKRQEKKLSAKVELDRLRQIQEEAEIEKKKKLDELEEEKERKLTVAKQEIEVDRQNGQRIIESNIKEQLAEHQGKFVKKFAESTEKDKLLARHDGETKRLNEYLDSEKRRQETDLKAKLNQRLVDRCKDIEAEFRKNKELLENKCQAVIDENEAKRAIVEGQVPISESKLMDYAEQIEADQDKVLKQKQKSAQNDVMMVDAKKQGEEDGLEKEYQLEEKKIQLDGRNELEQLSKKKVIRESELKDKFTNDLKRAPTSKEKSDLLNQYEAAKNSLEKMFEDERLKMEDKMEAKLAERRRQKDKKKIQLEAEALQQKAEINKKIYEDLYTNADQHSADTVMKLLEQALKQKYASDNVDNKQNAADIPVIFEYLVGSKTSQNINTIKKAQFTELSQQLGSMYNQIMKEKFLDVLANKEATKKKIKALERKSLPPNKFQTKLDRIQKEEVKVTEAINVNYENRSVTQESRIRIALAEQHYNEQMKVIDSEEAGRKHLLDKMLQRYNEDGIIPKNVIEELNKKKAEEFNEMREDAKNERDKKIVEAQQILGDMDHEDLKEIERKCAKEIEAESKELDTKWKKKKQSALEERKKQYEERLNNIPAISIDQRKQLMEEHKNDMERLEANMNAAREDQLKKQREKLINKKIQQERIRSRTEQKVMKKINEMNNDQVVIVEGQREQLEAAKAKVKAEKKANPYNYMMLMKQWAQKVETAHSVPQKPVADVVERNVVEENKEEVQINDADGAYVNMKELFETVLSCYDLAVNVQDFEFPEIAKAIEKLTYFMEAVLKGGKRLAEANVGRLGPKPIT